MEEGNTPCVVDVKFDSYYVEPSDRKKIPFTMRGFMYNHNLFNKIRCLYWWMLSKERLSFNEWLDEPIPYVVEWEDNFDTIKDEEIMVQVDEELYNQLVEDYGENWEEKMQSLIDKELENEKKN